MILKHLSACLADPIPSYMEVLTHINAASSLCYNATPPMALDELEKKVLARIKAGHETVIEHIAITAYICCDRATSHELVRHRLASFTQASTRYTDYSSDKQGGHCIYIIPNHPDFIHVLPGTYAQAETDCLPIVEEWMELRLQEERAYKQMVTALGIDYGRRELSHHAATEMYMTANLREWRHIFKLRALDTTGRADPHIKWIAWQLLSDMVAKYPCIFSDLLALKK